jgi:hypothetical protein
MPSLIESSRAEIDSLIIDAIIRGIGEDKQTKESDVGWIGRVPEHWDVVRTRFVAELHSGHIPSKSNDEY